MTVPSSFALGTAICRRRFFAGDSSTARTFGVLRYMGVGVCSLTSIYTTAFHLRVHKGQDLCSLVEQGFAITDKSFAGAPPIARRARADFTRSAIPRPVAI